MMSVAPPPDVFPPGYEPPGKQPIILWGNVPTFLAFLITLGLMHWLYPLLFQFFFGD